MTFFLCIPTTISIICPDILEHKTLSEDVAPSSTAGPVLSSSSKKCVEDYNYWKECISQFKRVAKDNPAQYSYGKLEKLIFEFCVDVTVHHLKLVIKY